jgi:hypothetical protein
MPLFRFYRITSTEGPEEYIGSTTRTLSARFSSHKRGYKYGNGESSSVLFDKYGFESCSIVLINEEEMEKADALRQERRLIEASSMVVNKLRPILESEERREYRNKQQHKYREAHREEVNERQRKYIEAHHDEEKERHRKYYETHRDTISACRAKKIPCDVCGKHITRQNIAQHKRSKSCVPPAQ